MSWDQLEPQMTINMEYGAKFIKMHLLLQHSAGMVPVSFLFFFHENTMYHTNTLNYDLFLGKHGVVGMIFLSNQVANQLPSCCIMIHNALESFSYIPLPQSP